MDKYETVCPVCGRRMKPSLDCACPDHVSLVYSDYAEKALRISGRSGVWKYIGWLPCGFSSSADSGPVTYKSAGLARALNLKNLYISFNGYWPERGAAVASATFKEYEAIVTLQRIEEFGVRCLVVASAGNTARAFAHVARQHAVQVIAVVPSSNAGEIWLPDDAARNFMLITVKDADYLDAIQVSSALCRARGLMPEGGAQNIARRDGLATVMLDAAHTIGDIPRHYFQAVGSGTGAIAAFEGVKRLCASGHFMRRDLCVHLAQNLPFTPIANAWGRRAEILDEDLDLPDGNPAAQVSARMLTNRRPPYAIPGGVYEMLRLTNGHTYAISNEDSERGRCIFEQLEGVDIVPEAGVACAALEAAVKNRAVDPGDVILLNVTGGGIRRLREEKACHCIAPAWEVDKTIGEQDLRDMRLPVG